MLTAENWARQIFIGLSSELYKQWGFTNNTGRPYITFPFKFSNVFTAISCICHNGSPSEANTVYNVSISGMNIGASGGGSGKYWCAFGVAQQQWGKILGDTVNLKIINFPVSFNECFGGLALFNGDPVAAAECATITDITNTNFKIYMYANNAGTGYANANIFYLFLGAQPQWGFTVFDPVDYKNVNFTLPLSVNGTFCAFSTGYDPKGSTFLWHSMSHFNNVNVGVTGFVFDSRYTFTGLGYLAVCWQKQWGYGNSESTQTFPIKFTNSVIGIYGSKRAINYEYTFAATSITNTNFFMSTRNSEGSSRVIACNWLAIGQQKTK